MLLHLQGLGQKSSDRGIQRIWKVAVSNVRNFQNCAEISLKGFFSSGRRANAIYTHCKYKDIYRKIISVFNSSMKERFLWNTLPLSPPMKYVDEELWWFDAPLPALQQFRYPPSLRFEIISKINSFAGIGNIRGCS